MRPPVVYVPNNSFHTFEKAEQFGPLVFLTEGRVNQFRTNDLARKLAAVMANSQASDYLLVSSLPILNALAASILSYKHGRVRYLIFNGDIYEQREVVFSNNNLGVADERV